MSRESDYQDSWWRGGKKKPGNRHKQRRKNRRRGGKVLQSLSIVDGHGRLRIHLGCHGGKQPAITLFDAEGNPRLEMGLRHGGSYESPNGGGFVTVENPEIILRDNGKAIRVSIDSLSGETVIRLIDAVGRTDLTSSTEHDIRAASEP